MEFLLKMSTQIQAPLFRLAGVFLAAVCTFVYFPQLSYAAYKSSSTNNGETAGNASTATVPSGVVSGDIVVCVVSIDDSGDSFTWPSGFVELYDVDNSTDGHSHGVAWKRLTAADSGSYTITHANGTGASFVTQCAAFSGRSSVSDPTASDNVSNASNASPVSVSATGVTAFEGDDILWIGALDTTVSNPGTTFASPLDYTERQDTNYIWNSVSLATRDNVSAGSTGTVTGTATLTNGVAGWHGFLVRMPSSVTFPAPSVLSKPPNNLGLAGYWSFNEGNGTIATDFSGNGNHGTLSTFASPATSASGWTNQGRLGEALHFDGNNDEVITADINATDGTQNMTVSFWIKTDALADWTNLLSKINGTSGWSVGTGNGNDVDAGGNDDLVFYPDLLGSGDGVYTDIDAHQTGVWEHWIVAFDGTIVNDLDSVRFYKNGVEITTKDQTAGIGNTTDSNTTPISIGGDDINTGGGDAEFDGIIDEVRIYSRTLTATEAMSLYGSGAARIVGSTKTLQAGSSLASGLVNHFSFDGADFTNFLADASGAGNNGFLFGTATSTMRTNGILGQAMLFDGTDDTARSVDINATDSASQLTLSAWIKPTALADWTPFISKCDCDGGTANWNFGMSNAGNGSNNDLSFFPDGASGAFTTSNILTLGVWQHVAVVYDGSQADANKITFYHNGIPYAETLFENPSIPTQTASNSIKIGLGQHGGTTGDPFYNGAMDDARVYTRALSTTEIKQLYNLGRAVVSQ